MIIGSHIREFSASRADLPKDIMHSVPTTSSCITALLLLSLIQTETNAKPWTQHYNPIGDVAVLTSATVVCTEQMANLCQQCAKKTKSAVVYPWCCANHEGAREWCENYLHFGLP